MADKESNRRYCAYKTCRLPDNNAVFLVQFLYLFVLFLVLIKDFRSVTILNMLLFVAPSTIDVICFKHEGKAILVFRGLFIAVVVVFIIFSAMIASGEMIDGGEYYRFVSTLPLIGGKDLTKWVILILSALMAGVPLLLYFARPNKKHAKALEILAESMGGK